VTPEARAALGLAEMAFELGRDLQRAARVTDGPLGLWTAPPERLRRALRLGGDDGDAAVRMRAGIRPEVRRDELASIGIETVALGEPHYPDRLAEIFDPPFGLFARGDLPRILTQLDERPIVAIVGSRRPTPAGARFARDLAHELAARGAVIVSGLARGIDAAAHEGAIAATGTTIAVLGSGFDRIYPRAHAGLFRRVTETGLGLSEYWPATTPAPWRFPARNRIVAGLSHAVVVVEAGERSGALITADFALEYGRPVLAVPGPPWADTSTGCNSLLRAGAALCTGVEDVIAEIDGEAWAAAALEPRAAFALDGVASQVWEALSREPLRLDQLAERVEHPAEKVASVVALLEVEGLVLRGDGQRYWAAPQSLGAG
jgi:DNA processing protein